MMLSLLIRSLLIYCFTLIITDNEDYFTLQHYVLSLFNTKHAIFCSSEWIVIGLENFISCIFSHGIYFLIYHTKCMCRIKTSFTINIYIYIYKATKWISEKKKAAGFAAEFQCWHYILLPMLFILHLWEFMSDTEYSNFF